MWLPLKPSDRIDIIAPASASSPEAFSRGKEFLQQSGYSFHYPEDLIQVDLFFASSLERQWEQFHNALFSDSKVIWCLRGGYGSMRLIPFLEKLSPPPTPKAFVGFSDITALHLFLNQKWNWPTLHGRTISQMSPDKASTPDREELMRILAGETHEVKFQNLIPLNTPAKKMDTLKGKIVGGNLRILQSSLGTSWQLDAKNKILFIEDVSERGYSVDRMLEQLFQAKIIDQDLVALVIGDFTSGEEKNGTDLVPEAIARFAQRVNYPVLSGIPAGHGKVLNYTVPFNTESVLDLKNCELRCQVK